MNPVDTMNSTPPRVSVVLGIYNAESTLADTLESLLSQTFQDIEIIAIDDGSTDGTAAVIDQFRLRDQRVVAERQQNQGLTSALIRGCQLARGDYIARIDAGDLADSRRIEKQVDFLDSNQDVVAIGTGVSRIGPKGEFLGETVEQVSPDSFTKRFLSERIGLCHPSSMFRAAAYHECGGYRKPFRYAQDTDLWFRLSRYGWLSELPESLLQLRIDTDGISPSNHRRQQILAELAHQSYECLCKGQDDIEILNRAEQVSWGALPDDSAPTQSQIRAQAEFFIGSQLFVLRDNRSRHYLVNAIKHRPLWIRPWAKLVLSFLQR